ncbi:MAG: MerR family transcriptional regulator [Limnohabitans sp.]|nr:MerR family transcriptional regulator [Limnohabitans sp.]
MNRLFPTESILMSIAAVERDSGIGKDTLRVWERRYNFPQPTRDAYGERAYPLEQVEKLRVIKRLMDQRLRPGKIVSLPIHVLNRMSLDRGPALEDTDMQPQEVQAHLLPYLQLIKMHDVVGLQKLFSEYISKQGLSSFVNDCVAPFNLLVGEEWMCGNLQVFEEHLYSQCVTQTLHWAMLQFDRPTGLASPKVLLTTFPEEGHGLGLLMVQCMFELSHCSCLSLGVQTPIRDVVLASQAQESDIVALSFSSSMNPNHVVDGLNELRQQLPLHVEVWAGGNNPILSKRQIKGASVMKNLYSIHHELQKWRKSQA